MRYAVAVGAVVAVLGVGGFFALPPLARAIQLGAESGSCKMQATLTFMPGLTLTANTFPPGDNWSFNSTPGGTCVDTNNDFPTWSGSGFALAASCEGILQLVSPSNRAGTSTGGDLTNITMSGTGTIASMDWVLQSNDLNADYTLNGTFTIDTSLNSAASVQSQCESSSGLGVLYVVGVVQFAYDNQI